MSPSDRLRELAQHFAALSDPVVVTNTDGTTETVESILQDIANHAGRVESQAHHAAIRHGANPRACTECR